jgi:hypothetical protein
MCNLIFAEEPGDYLGNEEDIAEPEHTAIESSALAKLLESAYVCRLECREASCRVCSNTSMRDDGASCFRTNLTNAVA